MTHPLHRELTVLTPDAVSIVVRREFAAPPELVWRAHTEADHLRRWLGRADFPLTTCEMDVRIGGRYRWVFTRTETGETMGVAGAYTEVQRPDRLVNTEQFDDFPGPSTNTMELTRLEGGRTAMSVTARYVDEAMRDGWLASGMTDGMSEGYARLDDVLSGLDGD